MSRSSSHYWKFQTRFVRLPAAIEAFRGTETVGICIHPERKPTDKPPAPGSIYLDPHEAIGFAAWLHEQAEHIIAKQSRAAARRAARAAKSR